METKSHLFEIMQFGFLPDILLFIYLSVLLKPNFLKKWIIPGFDINIFHFKRKKRNADDNRRTVLLSANYPKHTGD